MFVRHDARRPPLTRPVPRPLRRTGAERQGISSLHQRPQVSVNRLKPAYLESDEPAPRTFTSAGRLVRPPDRLHLAPQCRFRRESLVDRSAWSLRLIVQARLNRKYRVRVAAWVASFEQASAIESRAFRSFHCSPVYKLRDRFKCNSVTSQHFESPCLSGPNRRCTKLISTLVTKTLARGLQ